MSTSVNRSNRDWPPLHRLDRLTRSRGTWARECRLRRASPSRHTRAATGTSASGSLTSTRSTPALTTKESDQRFPFVDRRRSFTLKRIFLINAICSIEHTEIISNHRFRPAVRHSSSLSVVILTSERASDYRAREQGERSLSPARTKSACDDDDDDELPREPRRTVDNILNHMGPVSCHSPALVREKPQNDQTKESISTTPFFLSFVRSFVPYCASSVLPHFLPDISFSSGASHIPAAQTQVRSECTPKPSRRKQ